MTFILHYFFKKDFHKKTRLTVCFAKYIAICIIFVYSFFVNIFKRRDRKLHIRQDCNLILNYKNKYIGL